MIEYRYPEQHSYFANKTLMQAQEANDEENNEEA